MIDAELRRRLLVLADEAERHAKEAAARGELLARVGFLELALMARAALDPLAAAEVSANLQAVTGIQLERRGRAIAKGHAANKGDALLAAIAASRWGSQETYARKRLRVSPASLTAYRKGTTPVPQSIADRTVEDLGIPADYWTTAPRSVTD